MPRSPHSAPPPPDLSPAPFGALEALQLSLQLALTRLLGTCNGLSIAQFLRGDPGQLAYGMPDTRDLSPRSALDRHYWELAILRAIALYEPRLIEVRVAVTPERTDPGAARVGITALAALAGGLCQFHFDGPLDNRNSRHPALPG